MNAQQAREFIRHPSSIPLEVSPQTTPKQMNLKLTNISEGGLSFCSPVEFDQGTVIRIKIPIVKPVFKVNAIVQWCQEANNEYEMGVQFLDSEDAFRVRMIEQVCHIEEYRKQQQDKMGKRMTRNKASLEWIAKHGPNFPH